MSKKDRKKEKRLKRTGKLLWVIMAFVFLTACSSDVSTLPGTELVETAGGISTEKESGNVTETESQSASEDQSDQEAEAKPEEAIENSPAVSADAIPAYSGSPYVTVNDNVPFFTDSEMVTTPFEYYSDLDSLGRCGTAYANVCKEIMPTEKRGAIGSVKPTGWHTVKYDIVDGKYLYNRCHLIGYQLSGENANTKNLITGTRYLNVDGMLPFENMVADYVKETGNHVLYRVTPVFDGNNLVADGVRMEAKSVEDNGAGILFHVYCYNVQPGVSINYENGDSSLAQTEAPQEDISQQDKAADNRAESSDQAGNDTAVGESGADAAVQAGGDDAGSGAVSADTDDGAVAVEEQQDNASNEQVTVHITATGKKYHRAGCRYLKESDSEVSLDDAKAMGLSPCSVCNPPQ